MSDEPPMKIMMSELDLEMSYMVARGMSYRQISEKQKLTVQTVKNRMAALERTCGATSLPHLIAILIASDVLRVHDLYQELDVVIREYKRGRIGAQCYNLKAMRL